MNPTKIIHRIVIRLGAEELFVRLRRRASFLRQFIPLRLRHRVASFGRFIPLFSTYPKDDSYFLIREQTSFKINRSDYVQWRIFYGVRDNALRYAKLCLSSDSIILDIGANCGAFSLKLASHAAQCNLSNFYIHAFEPNPIVFNNYIENLQLNPSIQNLVHVHPFGFGSQHEEKSFRYPETNTGVGRVLQGDSTQSLKVSIQRLDDFVEQINPVKISFIKLIVEGFEPEVFKGGWNTIKKYRPPIFFEVTKKWYEENNSSVEEVVNALRSLGYKFMIEQHNEMIPYDESKFSDLIQFNLLADFPFHEKT